MRIYKKYWQVWKLTASAAFQTAFVNRATNVLFLLGKVLRFGMSLIFLLLIRQNIESFGGYSTNDMIVFFLVYQFVDVISQVLYRGVYVFGNLIRNGDFDFHLAQPVNPLFRALTGHPDINDALFLIPTMVVSGLILHALEISLSFPQLLVFLALLGNSLLISTALHVLILSIGILTTEIDGVIWIYRDFMRLGQFPVTIYMEPLRFALFFIIPVGMMVTLPAQFLLGITPTYGLLAVTTVGVGSLALSFFFWSWSLKRYTSASS